MYHDIVTAHSRIKSYIKQIPLYYSHNFSESSGGDIWFKLENLQRTGSFKIRGALNAMLKRRDECEAGVIAASAGNHAQGVAFAAKTMGVKAVIVMPKATPLVKVRNTMAHGAEVELFGDSFDAAYARATERAEAESLLLIHPFDDFDVMAGQGTIAHEIYSEMEDVDQVVVPIGGGGLIAGIGSYFRHVNPRIDIIGVQADGAAGMAASMRRGSPVRLATAATIAEGIAVKAVGKNTFDACLTCVDDIVTVTEAEIASAVLEYLERAKLVVEGAGAAPLATVLSRKIDVKGKKTVLVVSGGNIDVNLINRIISRGLAASGRFVEITATIKDVPGTLSGITDAVARLGANILDIRHLRSSATVPVGFTRVSLDLETKGFEHVDEIVAGLSAMNYDITVAR